MCHRICFCKYNQKVKECNLNRRLCGAVEIAYYLTRWEVMCYIGVRSGAKYMMNNIHLAEEISHTAVMNPFITLVCN
jgi:hypothetical protein